MKKQKIKFHLQGWNVWGLEIPGLQDYDNDSEREFALEEREGWLLQLTEMPFLAEDGQWIKFPCAVVEDSDGKVYRISPENVRFVKE